jgi:hypothetical protein
VSAVIVDTNVAKTANGDATASARCQSLSLDRLGEIMKDGQIVLDSAGCILDEYLGQGRYRRHPPGPGLAFFIWANDNQANPSRCRVVPITPLEDDRRQFEEFPDDPKLVKFDPSDRKFVAVAIACGDGTPVLNAVDTDWCDFEEPLAIHGVRVEFLCSELSGGRARQGARTSKTTSKS